MRKIAITLLLCTARWAGAAEWRTGQAARAVIGQRSFSAIEAGLNPVGLSAANGRLFVADASRRVFTYDLSAMENGGGECAVCLASPSASAMQAVPKASAQFAAYGSAVALADTTNRRVVFWKRSALPNAEIVLNSGDTGLVDPVSVALDGHYLYVGDAALHRVLIWNTAALAAGQNYQAALGDGGIAGANTLTIPIALAVDSGNLFVADAGNHRVLVFSAGTTALAAEAVANSATLAASTLAPGTLITIRGDRLAAATVTAPADGSEPLPFDLDGQQVLVDGHAIPLLSVSPSEIRAQLPYSLTYAASANLYLRNASGSSNAIALRLASVSPGIFAFPGRSEPREGVLLHGGRPVTTSDPAASGEELVVWATGLGLTVDPDDAQPVAGVPYAGDSGELRIAVEAEVNGEAAQVLSAVLPAGAAGIYEVRVQLPADLPIDQKLTLQLHQGTAASNTVTFPAGRTRGQ